MGTLTILSGWGAAEYQSIQAAREVIKLHGPNDRQEILHFLFDGICLHCGDVDTSEDPCYCMRDD